LRIQTPKLGHWRAFLERFLPSVSVSVIKTKGAEVERVGPLPNETLRKPETPYEKIARERTFLEAFSNRNEPASMTYWAGLFPFREEYGPFVKDECSYKLPGWKS
jgi:hypothetical protein